MTASRPVVLVADDDPDILQLVALHLRRLGCDVITAADGSSALALAQERLPQLAVLDVSMPGLTGLDVTAALRAAEATREIPVILLTARVQSADVERGLEAGASGYVTKPFSPLELSERVRALLSPSA